MNYYVALYKKVLPNLVKLLSPSSPGFRKLHCLSKKLKASLNVIRLLINITKWSLGKIDSINQRLHPVLTGHIKYLGTNSKNAPELLEKKKITKLS